MIICCPGWQMNPIEWHHAGLTRMSSEHVAYGKITSECGTSFEIKITLHHHRLPKVTVCFEGSNRTFFRPYQDRLDSATMF